MQQSFLAPCIYIERIPGKGRGVFTSAPIEADSIIEIAPVIVMSAAEREWVDKTLLHDYIFEWGESSRQCCLALGWVSVYNHSYKSNCVYDMDFDAALIKIKTVRLVEPEEELCINYNGEWNNDKKVWFDTI